MTSLTLSIPDSLSDFLEQRWRTAGFASASEYIAMLVEEARDAEAKAVLREQIAEGLKGPFMVADDEFWEGIDAEVASREKAAGS